MRVLFLCLTALLIVSCNRDNQALTINSGNLNLEIDEFMRMKVNSQESDVPLSSEFLASDFLIGEKDFLNYEIQSTSSETIDGGKRWIIRGTFTENNIQIEKTTTLSTLEASPGMIITQSRFKNLGERISINKIISNRIKASSNGDEPPFWSFQGSSTSARADWIRPVNEGYYDKNYMGMNNSDYGGGIPVIDVWRKDVGVAIGHTNTYPTLVSLPTEMKLRDNKVSIAMEKEFPYPTIFENGEELATEEGFILVHEGDYYSALQQYSEFMQTQGISMPSSEEAAYESIWCAWGYERNFTLDEITGTLPKVKEMGIKWVVMDDGFQIAEGDWRANPERFSDESIKALVNEIHAQDMKAKIWWAPLAADPGSKVLVETPEARLFTEEWAPQFITWWDAYYLSPNNEFTEAHTRQTVQLFMQDWGFDGLKLDGQHMNATPADHNPASKLEYPEKAAETLPVFFKTIYDEARKIKPNAVVENCPCGTCMSFFNMPYMNQAVSSDPLSSWQIRHKGKTYKALIPNTAYYGDHVELSDDASDFASSFGIGAVLGTKFTWPKDNPTVNTSYLLTPEKEVIWKKWFSMYDEHMLSKEKYLGNLYDIGYDKPESHVVQKEKNMYYSFYADEWAGKITFKGLEDGRYIITDYVNDKELGTVSNENRSLDIDFKGYLLVVATPE